MIFFFRFAYPLTKGELEPLWVEGKSLGKSSDRISGMEPSAGASPECWGNLTIILRCCSPDARSQHATQTDNRQGRGRREKEEKKEKRQS